MDGQRLPVVRAELEDRDRLVHPAEQRLLLLEDLHHDARVALVVEQHLARVVEVRVGVVALPHLLDREVEDLGREPRPPSLDRHLLPPRAAGRRRARPRRPRAARGRLRGRASRCWSSWPGLASARESGLLRVAAPSSAKTSVDAATRAERARRRARRAAQVRGRARGERVADRHRREQRADRGASRSARAPSRASRRARTSRSRCARRRGRRRAPAPRSASAAGASESSPATSSARRGAERPASRARLDRDRAAASIAASTAGRSNGSRASGSRAAHLAAAARTPRRGGPGRAGTASRPSPRGSACTSDGDLQLAVLGADRAGPGVRAVHEHAVRERHPAEPQLLVGHGPTVATPRPVPRGGGSRRRARGRRPRSARRPSGRAEPRPPGPSSASGRSRTRRCRRPRAASGCR